MTIAQQLDDIEYVIRGVEVLKICKIFSLFIYSHHRNGGILVVKSMVQINLFEL